MAFQEGKVSCPRRYDYLREEKKRHMARKITLKRRERGKEGLRLGMVKSDDDMLWC